eukprot:scaffold7682_cov315-Pinguiococcus_pyrenoidosus.AAC.3
MRTLQSAETEPSHGSLEPGCPLAPVLLNEVSPETETETGTETETETETETRPQGALMGHERPTFSMRSLTASCDTGAYVTGMVPGSHRLSKRQILAVSLAHVCNNPRRLTTPVLNK